MNVAYGGARSTCVGAHAVLWVGQFGRHVFAVIAGFRGLTFQFQFGVLGSVHWGFLAVSGVVEGLFEPSRSLRPEPDHGFDRLTLTPTDTATDTLSRRVASASHCRARVICSLSTRLYRRLGKSTLQAQALWPACLLTFALEQQASSLEVTLRP